MSDEKNVELPNIGEPKFTDYKGREWDVKLTLGSAKRIDASDFSDIRAKKFSILEPSRELFMEILNDTSLVMAIAWVIVQPQVKENFKDYPKCFNEDGTVNLNEAELEFLEGMDGPTIMAGREAVWSAVADFFPEHKTGLLILMQQFLKSHKRLAVELKGMEMEIDKIFEKELDKGIQDFRQEVAQFDRKTLGRKRG